MDDTSTVLRVCIVWDIGMVWSLYLNTEFLGWCLYKPSIASLWKVSNCVLILPLQKSNARPAVCGRWTDVAMYGPLWLGKSKELSRDVLIQTKHGFPCVLILPLRKWNKSFCSYQGVLVWFPLLVYSFYNPFFPFLAISFSYTCCILVIAPQFHPFHLINYSWFLKWMMRLKE